MKKVTGGNGSWRARLPAAAVLALPFFTAAGIILRTGGAAIPVAALPAPFILSLVLLGSPRGRLAALAVVPLCFLAAGFARSGAIFPPPDPDHVANIVRAPTTAAVTGTVTSVDFRSPGQSRFILTCETLATTAGNTRSCQGRIAFVMHGELPAGITAGERVAVRGRLRPARATRTPGVSDYRLYLARKSVWTTGAVTKGLVVRLTREHAPIPPGVRLERLRQRARAFIAAHTTGDSGAVYRALLTGDPSAIRPGLRRSFARTGASHLLAISGMHMGAIFTLALGLAAALAAVFPVVLLHVPLRKLAGAVALGPLMAYALLAGMKPPVFRAAVMTCAFIAVVTADRRYSPAAALAMAATLVMLVFPASLFSASFQLSFAAVSVIIMLWKKLRPWRRRLAARPGLLFLLAAAGSGIAAQAGTLPFSLAHFNQVSLLGVPVTILLLPLLCFWALPLGLAALAAAPSFPAAAAAMLRAGAPAINAAIGLVTHLAALPGAAFHLPDPPLPLVAGYLAAIVTVHRLTKRPATFLAAILLLPPLFIAATAAIPAAARKLAPRPRAVFLDVGQGSATVIFTPGGHTLLIDAGGSSSPRFDPGERIIARYLFHAGVRRLDTVVLTHAHADHTCGLGAMVRLFSPRLIWTNGSRENHALTRVLARAAAQGSKVAVAAAGDTLFAETGARLVCLRDGGGNRGNAGSLVLLYHGGGTRIIFPGDIPVSVQQRLAAAGTVPAGAILLAPHHGSPAYFDTAFARAARPALVIISTGANARVAPGWRKAASLPPEITARNGTVTVTASESGTIRVNHPWQTQTLFPEPEVRPR